MQLFDAVLERQLHQRPLLRALERKPMRLLDAVRLEQLHQQLLQREREGRRVHLFDAVHVGQLHQREVPVSALTMVLVMLALPGPEAAKLFSDKGSLYFRTDHVKALTVGAELAVVADASSVAPLGKAVIMEVSGKLARVSLDEEAGKSGAKFVLLPRPKGVAVVNVKPTGPKLNGTLESGTLRVTISNNSDTNWTGCELQYSDGSTYKLGEMVKHSDDTVLKVKFSSVSSPVYDTLLVSCAEGESRFYFSKPTAPVGSLKGYAVNDGRSDVVVYNSSESAWTQCDVKKPDRSHYVLGTLKGHDHDSINGGRFKKEAEGPISWLDIRCKEGWLRQPL